MASCLDNEIDGEIIVLGRNDGGSDFKWFGETVNPMEIKNEIIPTLEEKMEILDILVKDNYINEGEYKLKTDKLQQIWNAENGEDEEEEEEDVVIVVSMLMNGEEVYLNEINGLVYNSDEELVGRAHRLNRTTWTIFNTRRSGQSPHLLTYYRD